MIPSYAAVDWGTSRFRLWLLAEDGTVLNQVSTDDGLQLSAEKGFSNILEAHLAALNCPPDLPVIICGMAGSRSGWKEAQYLDAPVDLDAIVENSVTVFDDKRDIRILPGIAQRDASKPDVMRGEETQLFGMSNAPEYVISANKQIICMPGTHSKWVTLEGRRLTHFTTFMTGELFALLSNNSVLKFSMADGGNRASDSNAFLEHVAAAIKNPQEISAQLFAIRPSNLLGFTDAATGRSALSGTLIGLEMAGAFSRHGKPEKLILMAGGMLGELYAMALAACGVEVEIHDAEKAGMNGMWKAAKILWGDKARDETRKL